MEHRYRNVAVVLGMVGTTAACGGVNQAALDAEIAAVRSEMQQGDEGLSGRIEAGETRMGQLEERIDVLQVMSGRVEDLGQELQSAQRDFSADIEQLEAAIRFNSPVHFDYDSDSLRSEDRPLLDQFASIVGTYYPVATVTIEGFTDPAGDAEYNVLLGDRRANVVKDYLLGQGLAEQRVRVVSYGESPDRQIVPGGWGDNGLANRRVALVIDYSGDTAEVVAGSSPEGSAH